MNPRTSFTSKLLRSDSTFSKKALVVTQWYYSRNTCPFNFNFASPNKSFAWSLQRAKVGKCQLGNICVHTMFWDSSKPWSTHFKGLFCHCKSIKYLWVLQVWTAKPFDNSQTCVVRNLHVIFVFILEDDSVDTLPWQVRSVTLDTWLPEQVAFIQGMFCLAILWESKWCYCGERFGSSVQFFANIQLSFMICNAFKYEEELMFISPFIGFLNMFNINWRALHNISLNHFRSMRIFLNVDIFSKQFVRNGKYEGKSVLGGRIATFIQASYWEWSRWAWIIYSWEVRLSLTLK